MERFNGCTPPMPFSTYRHNQHLSHKQNTLMDQLFNMTHLNHIQPNTSHEIYNLFQSFARCAVPPADLLTLNMADEKNSSLFWEKLTKFMLISVHPAAYNKLVEAGIPYVSLRKGECLCVCANTMANVWFVHVDIVSSVSNVSFLICPLFFTLNRVLPGRQALSLRIHTHKRLRAVCRGLV